MIGEWAQLLFEKIKHGDEAHRVWLRAAIQEFFTDQAPDVHRMRIERDLAMAQGRDVVRQFNEQLDRTRSAEAELQEVRALLKQALLAKESAVSQAEHFLQQRMVLEAELSRSRDARGSVSPEAPGYHEVASAVLEEPSRIPLPESSACVAAEASPQPELKSMTLAQWIDKVR